jgi:hypothetical protein
MQIVPQYIDVEDKIAGPLTWKHLGWFFGGGGLLMLAYAVLDKMTFYIVAVIIISLTVIMAFYRPNGVSMMEFVGYGINFLFHPKVYTWEREMQTKVTKKQKEEVKIKTVSGEKIISMDEITALAQTLDSGGKDRNEKIQELIKKQANKK